MGSFQDLTLQRFSRLVVVSLIEKNSKATLWACLCDCGNLSIVRAGNLKNGHTKSCGCFSSEQSRERVLKRERPANIKRIHEIYRAMKKRCYTESHPHFGRYGGRGILICDEWLSSKEAFTKWALSNGYSDNLTIDRIDVDGNYSPQNCRWATYREQMRNKSSTAFVEYDGELLQLQDFLDKHGLSYNRYYHCVKKQGGILNGKPIRQSARIGLQDGSSKYSGG